MDLKTLLKGYYEDPMRLVNEPWALWVLGGIAFVIAFALVVDFTYTRWRKRKERAGRIGAVPDPALVKTVQDMGGLAHIAQHGIPPQTELERREAEQKHIAEMRAEFEKANEQEQAERAQKQQTVEDLQRQIEELKRVTQTPEPPPPAPEPERLPVDDPMLVMYRTKVAILEAMANYSMSIQTVENQRYVRQIFDDFSLAQPEAIYYSARDMEGGFPTVEVMRAGYLRRIEQFRTTADQSQMADAVYVINILAMLIRDLKLDHVVRDRTMPGASPVDTVSPENAAIDKSVENLGDLKT